MDFKKVTRVNYAFFQIDTAGNIWGTDDWADVSLLMTTVVSSCKVCRLFDELEHLLSNLIIFLAPPPLRRR